MQEDGWACHVGPIVYDSIYNGEVYDARLEAPVRPLHYNTTYTYIYTALSEGRKLWAVIRDSAQRVHLCCGGSLP